MITGLPLDLKLSVAALSERFNACRLITIEDVESELPARPLRSDEVTDLLEALAGEGLSIVDADPAHPLEAQGGHQPSG